MSPGWAMASPDAGSTVRSVGLSFRAALVWLVTLLAIPGCGGTDEYSEEEVIAAFARQGIVLVEVIRPGEGSDEEVLEVILGPSIAGDRELSVNLFSSERELDEYLTRAWGRNFDGCRRTKAELGCKQRNILVSLDLASRRFDPQRIERALADLR